MAVTIAKLYRRVPAIECQGKCAQSCGPIVVTRGEHRAMVDAAGGQPFTVDAALSTCGYLKDGRCSIYDARPLLCRLWGVADPMVCPYGCTPARRLTRQQGYQLLRILRSISGRWVAPATPPGGPLLSGPDD